MTKEYFERYLNKLELYIETDENGNKVVVLESTNNPKLDELVDKAVEEGVIDRHEWQDLCNKFGVISVFDSEVEHCSRCGKVLYRNDYRPNSYYIDYDACEVVCKKCMDIDEYIEYLSNNDTVTIRINELLPESTLKEKGWELVDGDFENSLYEGGNDDPREQLKKYENMGYKVIFSRTNYNPFGDFWHTFVKYDGETCTYGVHELRSTYEGDKWVIYQENDSGETIELPIGNMFPTMEGIKNAVNIICGVKNFDLYFLDYKEGRIEIDDSRTNEPLLLLEKV